MSAVYSQCAKPFSGYLLGEGGFVNLYKVFNQAVGRVFCYKSTFLMRMSRPHTLGTP